MISTAPLGTVLSFAGSNAPNGYLLCDGKSYAVADYEDLYAVIGNTYGGDTENFNVPDYRETVLVGVGENTTDTITNHDVYELGEFKDDQLQGHKHIITQEGGSVPSNVSPNSPALFGGTTGSSNTTAMKETYTDGTNGTPRVGTTTHGKQKGVTYIIKAFHTNEGTDSGVSDDVVDYVDNKVDGLISDTDLTSTTSTLSANKIKNAVTYSFDTQSGSVKYVKFKPSVTTISVVDIYGGKIEILGASKAPSNPTYKTVKVVRLSYGDWGSYDATQVPSAVHTKIGELYYYPTDEYYYLKLYNYAAFTMTGLATAPEIIASLPAEESAMTLIPERDWGKIDDTTSSTESTWSSSKIASEINPTIDISKVFSGGALNISTLCGTYGNGRYVIVGQGTAGNGSATIDIWTLASNAISYIVNVTYSNKTSNTFIGLTYENPTVNFETNYLSACNHIAKVCTLV